MTTPWYVLSWIVALSASASASPSLELSLTESNQPTPASSHNSSVTVITLQKGELTVHEHVQRGARLTGNAPPDRDHHRTLEADELGKVRALLGESQLMASGSVDAGRPRGGCGGIEYRLELSVNIDGKRLHRQVRGPTLEFCRKSWPDFAGSRALADSRHLVEGLKALVDPP